MFSFFCTIASESGTKCIRVSNLLGLYPKDPSGVDVQDTEHYIDRTEEVVQVVWKVKWVGRGGRTSPTLLYFGDFFFKSETHLWFCLACDP